MQLLQFYRSLILNKLYIFYLSHTTYIHIRTNQLIRKFKNRKEIFIHFKKKSVKKKLRGRREIEKAFYKDA